MNIIRKTYKKFTKHRKNETKQIVRLEVVQNAMKISALKRVDSLLSADDRDQKIVVSLTTHGSRINSVYLAIESIAWQTIKPDKIILWVSEKDFDEKNLPIILQRFIKLGLDVRFIEDIGPHTKLFYALQNFPNDMVISVDDDIIYPFDMIENLLNTYNKNPNCICCNVAMKIGKDRNGKILPYKLWDIISQNDKGMHFLPLGVNGVLYFPGCFDDEVYKKEKISVLSPKADDVWFKLMSLKNNINVAISGAYLEYKNDFIALDTSFVNALAVDNILNNENDKQFMAVLKEYQLSV